MSAPDVAFYANGLTGKTDEQEHSEWDALRERAAIEGPLRRRIAELEAALRSARTILEQCPPEKVGAAIFVTIDEALK